MHDKRLSSFVDTYLRSLRVSKKRTTLTLSHYKSYLARFFSEAGVRELSDISLARVNLFKKKLQKEEVSPTTINYHLIAVRNFIRSIPERARPIGYRDIELERARPNPTRTIQRADVAQVLKQFDNHEHRDAILNLRDRALVLLISDTPLTLLQICVLRKSNIQKKRTIVSKNSHGQIDRYPLPATVARAVSDYLSERTDASPFLFIGHDRADQSREPKPLSLRSIQRIVINAGRSSGVHLTARTLQRSRNL